MKTLNSFQTIHVSGGMPPAKAAAVCLSAAVGSYVFGNVASTLGPVSTVLTTTAGVVGCGAVGTMVMPVVGTVVGATTCGVGAYYLGASMVTATSYGAGALISATAAYFLI